MPSSQRCPLFGPQGRFRGTKSITQRGSTPPSKPVNDEFEAEKEAQKHRSGELDTHFRRTTVEASGFQTHITGRGRSFHIRAFAGFPPSPVDSFPRLQESPEEFIRHSFILRRTSAHLPSFADLSALLRRRPRHTDQTTPIGAVVFSWHGCVWPPLFGASRAHQTQLNQQVGRVRRRSDPCQSSASHEEARRSHLGS